MNELNHVNCKNDHLSCDKDHINCEHDHLNCGEDHTNCEHGQEKTTIQVKKATLDRLNSIKVVLKKKMMSSEKLIMLALDKLVDSFTEEQKRIYHYLQDDKAKDNND